MSSPSRLGYCWALGTECISWPLGRKERQCTVGGETRVGLLHERQETPGAISHAKMPHAEVMPDGLLEVIPLAFFFKS